MRGRSAAEKAAIVGDVRAHVWPLVSSGRIRPVIEAILPLAEAAQAHRLMDDFIQNGHGLPPRMDIKAEGNHPTTNQDGHPEIEIIGQ